MQFGPRFTPDVVKWLIGVCLGAYLVLRYALPSLAPWLYLSPALVWEKLAVWQLATAPLMSWGGLALLFEMIALWMFGSELAIRWGRDRFLRYVALCGAGGAAAMLLVSAGFHLLGVDVGWSGTYPALDATVLAVMLAYSLLFADREILLFFVVPVRTLYFIPALLFIQLIMGAPALIWVGDLAALAIGAALCWQSGESRLTLQTLLHKFRRWRMRSKLRAIDNGELRRQRNRRNLH